MKKIIPIFLFLVAASSLLLMPISQAAGAKNETAKKVAKTAAVAPRYKLVEGKGYTVCESYLKHLNAFPPEEPKMICEHKINPKFPDLSYPNWEELSIDKDEKLFYEADIQVRKLWINDPQNDLYKTPKPPIEEWRKAFDERNKKGGLIPRLRRAKIKAHDDIIQDVVRRDNIILTIIAYEPDINECEKDLSTYHGFSHKGGGAHIFVLRDDKNPLLPMGADGYRYLELAEQHNILVHNGEAFLIRTLDSQSIFIETLNTDVLRPDFYLEIGRCKITIKP